MSTFDLTMFVEDTLVFKKYGAMPYRFEAMLPTAKKPPRSSVVYEVNTCHSTLAYWSLWSGVTSRTWSLDGLSYI